MPTLCCAFRASDLRPCAKTVRESGDVCHTHRNFYTKEEWLKKFVSLTSPFLLDCIVREQESITGRIVAAVEYSLTSGKIVLTEDDIAGLYCPPFREWFNAPFAPSFRPVYTVMVSTGKVNPRWNQDLLHISFLYYAKMYSWDLRNSPPSFDSYIMPFLTYPGEKPHELVMSLLAFHRSFLNYRHGHIPVQRYRLNLMSRQLAEECFSKRPVILASLYSIEEWKRIYDEKAASTPNFNIEPLKEILEELVPQSRAGAKELILQRMGPLKEEVIAAGWHPSRFEKWCLDEEERKEHDAMFA